MNITAPEFGEAQMMVEILACGSENIRLKVTDQTIFVVRVVSTYVTFYKSEISARYWNELKKGLPRKRGIEVLRWPMEKDPDKGLNLLEPAGRQAVLTALVRIRQFILQSSDTSSDTSSGTTTVSQGQAGSSTTTASQEQVEPSSKSKGKKPVK
jgi:hypothetical protein